MLCRDIFCTRSAKTEIESFLKLFFKKDSHLVNGGRRHPGRGKISATGASFLRSSSLHTAELYQSAPKSRQPFKFVYFE
jgi:hypothetical protein